MRKIVEADARIAIAGFAKSGIDALWPCIDPLRIQAVGTLSTPRIIFGIQRRPKMVTHQGKYTGVSIEVPVATGENPGDQGLSSANSPRDVGLLVVQFIPQGEHHERALTFSARNGTVGRFRMLHGLRSYPFPAGTDGVLLDVIDTRVVAHGLNEIYPGIQLEDGLADILLKNVGIPQ
jgi:hypothetical protein